MDTNIFIDNPEDKTKSPSPASFTEALMDLASAELKYAQRLRSKPSCHRLVEMCEDLHAIAQARLDRIKVASRGP